jgi:hypothetical protein
MRKLLLIAATFALVASNAHATVIVTSGLVRPALWGQSAISTDWLEYSVGVSSTGLPSDQNFLNVVSNTGNWLVQNLPVGYELGSSQMATLVPNFLYSPSDSYQTSISPNPEASMPAFVSGSPLAAGANTNYLANDPAGGGPDTTIDPAPAPTPGTDATLGFNFGNILGFSWHRGMPDITQGKDECYPSSAANSMKWLNPGLPLTAEQIRDQLKNDMKTNDTTPGNEHSGTYNKDFINGKNAFVNRNHLNIETHEITLAQILDEMNKGQDVELVITPKGKNWGHMVTLVGVLQTPFGAGFAMSDPDDGHAGQTSFLWADPAGQIKRGTYAGWELKWAWAESPIPEPASLALFAIGCIAVCAVRSRSRN